VDRQIPTFDRMFSPFAIGYPDCCPPTLPASASMFVLLKVRDVTGVGFMSEQLKDARAASVAIGLNKFIRRMASQCSTA
jgi:hypothetical protein